jgi:sugar lactone lactonase YvrE
MSVLLTSTSAARSHHVLALAPVELVADGFMDLAGLIVDGAGHLLVADRRAGTVTRIAPDRRRTAVASGLDRPAGLALDDAGALLIAEEGADRVVRLGADGRRTVLIAGIEAPRWLLVDDTGTVYVTGRRPARSAVREPDPAGGHLETIFAWSGAGGLRVFADGFRQLEGLAPGEGVLYAAAGGRPSTTPQGGVVYAIEVRPDGSAGAVRPAGGPGRTQRPVGIARDRLGALYIAASRLHAPRHHGDHVVVKRVPDGAHTAFASGLEDPHGLAFDEAGNLYVADGDAGRVVRFRAPAPPALDALPEFTRQTALVVRGTADRHARVTVATAQAQAATLTGSDGRFSATVGLAADARTVVEAFVTAFRGEGLTSAPAEAAITHDGVPPSVALLAPGAGAFVRGVVPVSAQAADGGSGLGTLTLTAGTPLLAGTTAPTLPAPSAIVSASWNTGALPDGAHALLAVAGDRAGNAVTAQREVLVDNTPPETSVVSGPAGSVTTATVSFAFTGADNLTPPPALRFSWRLDDGAWSPFTADTSVALSDVAQGPHRFEVRARDQAGNEDATPAVRQFAVGGLRVVIASPVAGATVGAGLLIVRGTVEGAPGEVAVAVNDVAATVAGREFAGAVVVEPGPTLLTVVATGSGGGTASATAPVTVVGAMASEALHASPASGVAPLAVTFSVSGVPDGARVDLDADGDASVDASGAGVDTHPFAFASPGLYVPSATITDGTGARTTVQTVVHVLDRAGLDALLQAKWGALKAALRAGDITAAVDLIVDERRADYGQAFGLLAARLPAIDAIMTDITFVWMRNAAALYQMVRVDAGVRKSFEVRFALGGDGVWRLESF